MLQKLYLFLILLCLTHFAVGQTEFKVDSLRVNQIGQADGLIQLNVKALYQDKLDYLWLATEDGLHRYNSVDFVVYINNPLEVMSIPEDHARDLYVANDTLFIASNSEGVFGLKLSTDTFINLSNTKSHEATNTSYKIRPLGKSYLLFSLRNSFILYHRINKTSRTIVLPTHTIENYVQDVMALDGQNFILATTASGLLKFNLESNTISDYKMLDDSSHNAVFWHNQLLYVGTNEGFYSLNPKTNEIVSILKDEGISSFYTGIPNQIWIGTDTGAYTYKINQKRLIKQVLLDQNSNPMTPIKVNDIKGDTKGNLWFATDGEGLLHYNSYREKFMTIKLKVPGLSTSKKISTFQFLPSKDSTLLIGSTLGIIKYDLKTKRFKQFPNHKKELIYTMVKDFNGTIWAGGFTTGLLKYDSENDRFTEVIAAKNNISDRDVIQITPRSKTELLVATWSGGLYTYDIEASTFSKYLINGKDLNRARTSFIDSKNNLWLGTDEGVFMLDDKGTLKTFTTKGETNNPISSDRIFGIAEDSKGAMWFGTSVGLTKLDVNSLKTTIYYKQKGHPNDFIYTVLIDRIDNIWVSTNFGISMLNTKTNMFTNYTQNDGLQNNEFNGKAGFKDLDDTFYFGGINGINIFQPGVLKTSPFLPKAHIESVELFNSKINRNELYAKDLEFNNDENVLTFNYVAVNYLNSDKVDYSYYMEGFDETWRPITKNKNITYTNLNPGSYVFKVKSTNANGVWSPYEDAMRLTIIPPWYQTTLFQFLGIVLILCCVFGFHYYKTYRLKWQNQQLELLVTGRTKEVQAKNDALNASYEVSVFQKENIKFLMRELQHRVKNNLQIVSSLLNIQSEHVENEVVYDALQVAKNRILSIANVEDILKLDSKTFDIKEFTVKLCQSILNALGESEQLKFSVEYQIAPLELNNMNTTVFGLILNELLTNISKHAFESYNETNLVVITCTEKSKTLTLSVSDNGKGYSEAAVSANSMGLELVRDMVMQVNGKLTITTIRGTVNVIEIPLD